MTPPKYAALRPAWEASLFFNVPIFCAFRQYQKQKPQKIHLKQQIIHMDIPKACYLCRR